MRQRLNNGLPKIAACLLKIFLPKKDREFLLGDYEFLFQDVVERRGMLLAKMWLWFVVLKAIPSFIINNIYWEGVMIKNFFKIALRNLARHKTYSLINIVSLAVGMASCVLIALWVQDETSYDNFHDKKDQIFRIIKEHPVDQGVGKSSGTPGKLAPAVKSQIPEVIEAVRITGSDRSLVRYHDKAFYEENIIYTDQSIFNVFSFPVLKGNASNVLSGMTNIVITEKIAAKYFGSDNPIGKKLNMDNGIDLMVTAVISDIPSNSHLQFDFMLSNALLEKWWPGGYSWTENNHWTYLLLHGKSMPKDIEPKITDIYFGNVNNVEKLISKLSLQPVTDIHLDTELGGGDAGMGDKEYIYIFSIIAFFILFIASINFMNLATARYLTRVKEVGIRKSIGANRTQLIVQFLGETFLQSVIASIAALVIVLVALPLFNQLTGKFIAVNISDIKIWMTFGAVVILTAVIAGSYPAFFLSSFKPVKILRGNTLAGSGNANFRKSMVITQFAVSIFLIVGMIIIHNQLEYMRTTDLGFDTGNILYIPARDNIGWKYEEVKNDLLSNSYIHGASLKRNSPVNQDWGAWPTWEGKTTEAEIFMENTAVDYDYFNLVNMEIVEGREFMKSRSTDLTDAVVVNEKAVELMGMKNPIGKKITYRHEGRIIGVVKNAHVSSLKYDIRPQIYYLYRGIKADRMWLYGVVLIRYGEGHSKEALAHIKNVWGKYSPDYPMEYQFLDEEINQQYLSEEKIAEISDGFTALAIFIACLGLFGLASFTIVQRKKEIGIRKILGADIPRITFYFSKEYLKWIAIANAIAWPVAYYVMTKWLQDFAYRIEIGWTVFVIAGVMSLMIVLLTIMWQAVQISGADPVDTLKHE